MSKIYYQTVACLLGLVTTAMFADSAEVVRTYRVGAQVYSLDGQQQLESFKGHGGGWGSPGSTLGYGYPAGEVRIEIARHGDRLFANLLIKDKEQSDEKLHKIDLTNMSATSFELATDDQGRTYTINLTPEVIKTEVGAKSFEKATDDLYRLRFHGSSVMLNEEQFVGRMLASDAEVFTVDLCGVAEIEFSLRKLKNAKPWGQLHKGRMILSHPEEGTSIEIANVTNGTNDQLVPGGPYQVWVRWKPANNTVEEYRASLTELRGQLLSKKAVTLPSGEELINHNTTELIAKIDQELAREPGPWVIGCSARSRPRK